MNLRAHSIRLLAALAVLALASGLQAQTGPSFPSGHAQITVQAVKANGEPIPYPRIGVKALSPTRPGWTLGPNAVLDFTILNHTPSVPVAGASLVIELRDRQGAWLAFAPDDPSVLGSLAFPLDQPGSRRLQFDDLFGPNPDPEGTYYLGAYLAGAAAHTHQVDFRLNNRQAGVFWGSGRGDVRFRFGDLPLYYRAAAHGPAPPWVQPAADSPHAVSAAPVSQVGGRDVFGVISGYAYAFEDAEANPGVFRRIWTLYRVPNAQTQGTVIWTRVVGGLDRRIRITVPTAAANQATAHYRLHCQTVDGYAMPSRAFTLDPARSDVFLFAVGKDQTAGACLRVGWQDDRVFPQTHLDPACDLNRGLDEGQVYAAPRLDDPADVQPGDRFTIRRTKANGQVSVFSCGQPPCGYPDHGQTGPFPANPADWARIPVARADFPVQLQWRWENAYGRTEYTAPVSIPYEPIAGPPPAFAPVAALEWETRPARVYPGMGFAVRLSANRGEGLRPHVALWLYNVDQPDKAVAVGQDSAASVCLLAPDGPDPVIERLRLPDDLTALDLGPGQGAALRAKVLWSADDPCWPQTNPEPFLADFAAPAPAGGLAAAVDSGTVTGQAATAPAFTQLSAMGDLEVNPDTGDVGFLFEEQHAGPQPAEALWWRWRRADDGAVWLNGAWLADDPLAEEPYARVGDGLIEDGGGAVDAFAGRWAWDRLNLVRPGTTPPFAPDGAGPLAESFFDRPGGRVAVVLEAKIRMGDVWVARASAPFTLTAASPDLHLAEVRLLETRGAGQPRETDHVRAATTAVPDLTLEIEFTSPISLETSLAVLAQDPATEQYAAVACGALANLTASGWLTSLTPATTPTGNAVLRVESHAGDGLHALLSGGAGRYKLRIGTEACVNGALPRAREKTVTVNPGKAFSLTAHYRDHLGSEVLRQTFSPVYEGSLPGAPLRYVIGDTPVWLYPHPVKRTVYAPFGEQLTPIADEARYTDHEYDASLALNYMKGRYQDPAHGMFTRPDPARDWDWLNPMTLNLYEYASNDPILRWDPNGRQDACAACRLTEARAKEAAQKIRQGESVRKVINEFAFGNPLVSILAAFTPVGDAMDAVDVLQGKQTIGGFAIGAIPIFGDIKKTIKGAEEAVEKTVAAKAVRGGTYKLVDPATKKVRRTGQTNNLNRRRKEHRRGSETGGLDFEVDRKSNSYDARRGREQRLYDQHPEADLNKRRPISPKNPKREHYLKEGDKLKKPDKPEEQ